MFSSYERIDVFDPENKTAIRQNMG